MRDRKSRHGQISVEFALLFAGVLVPTTFGTIFAAQILWTWHSINDFTRQGAGYAATHCWQGGSNVTAFMLSNLPLMPGNDQFQNGPVQIQVSYFAEDPTTGILTPFECDGDCTVGCIPDVVTVAVTNYQVRAFTFVPPITLPNFQATLPMESCGCDPETGICVP
jgi:hypothetical protein